MEVIIMEVQKEVEKHIKEVMRLLELPITESNKDTPKRVAKMWCKEIFANRNDMHLEELDASITTFPNEYFTDMVVMRDIPFYSTCEHHFMPFFGTATVGYIPDETVVGLSKIPRVVKYFSKRPQIQEQLTEQIGEYLFNKIKPKAIFVYMAGTHTCVTCRGAESNGVTETFFDHVNTDYAENRTKWRNEFRSRLEYKI